jgi:hypothetical protein
MKNFLLTILISFLSLTNLVAQNGNGKLNNSTSTGKISGSLYDAQTNQIIEYGNIVLFQIKDSSMVNGTISDKLGKFEIDNIKFGMYYLKLSYIGYAGENLLIAYINLKHLKLILEKSF